MEKINRNENERPGWRRFFHYTLRRDATYLAILHYGFFAITLALAAVTLVAQRFGWLQ